MTVTKSQKIRPSQFILTYGPGAILEGQNSPRIVLDANKGLFNEMTGDIVPDTYRIDDDRMSRGLLGGANIYRLPTSTEMSGIRPYVTKPFPQWRLCVRPHGKDGDYMLHLGPCPECGDTAEDSAVRFVMACRDGHLDDIWWNSSVHKGSSCTGESSNNRIRSGTAFYWHRDGGTLRDITIRCIYCPAEENFGTMYYSTHRCGGRHPQKENKNQQGAGRGCGRRAKIMARQSASLRIAETITLLSIRPIYTDTHMMLQNQNIASSIKTARLLGHKMDEATFKKIIANTDYINADTKHKLLNEDWDTVKDALEFVEKPVPGTYRELVQEEFGELRKASVNGAPPQAAGGKRAITNAITKVIFEANRTHIRSVTAEGIRFRITPIQKLRTVTVQRGFRREISDDSMRDMPTVVPVSFKRGGKEWYPGVEYMGEGIFIRLDTDGAQTDPDNQESQLWLKEFHGHDQGKYPKQAFRSSELREELHPWFVWWHTLAHLVVRTIGEDSGYSSAAIRERVYFEHGDGKSRGGILLYATQPGNEGTMGGLTGMAPHMEDILGKSFEACRSCSGDPLCADNRFRRGGYNGASCYACLLNSETSCEHRNMWLDRNVLNASRPQP